MPELNLRVKIICGKRTPLEVYVESQSVNSKIMKTKYGAEFLEWEIESVVDGAIIEFIDNLKGE